MSCCSAVPARSCLDRRFLRTNSLSYLPAYETISVKHNRTRSLFINFTFNRREQCAGKWESSAAEHNRIASKVRKKKNPFSASRSARSCKDDLLSHSGHRCHSSPTVSFRRLHFSRLAKGTAKKTQSTCVSTSSTTRKRRRDASFDTITNLTYCRSIRASSRKERLGYRDYSSSSQLLSP